MSDNDYKVTLAWPNLIGETTLSGGSYTAALPLSRAKSTPLARVSRSADLALSSTQFTAEFPRRRTISSFALCNHNLSVEAQIRIRVYNDVAQLQYDSDWLQVWPPVYNTLDLEWEDENYWFGTPTEEERSQFTPTFSHIFDDVTQAFEVHVEIDDQTNADGFVQFGLVVFAQAWQPTININYEVEWDHDDQTGIRTADDKRSEYFDVGPKPRTVRMTFEALNEDEAFAEVYLKQRINGIHGQVLFVYERPQTIYSIQRTFVGRLESTNPIRHPYPDIYGYSLNLREVL